MGHLHLQLGLVYVLLIGHRMIGAYKHLLFVKHYISRNSIMSLILIAVYNLFVKKYFIAEVLRCISCNKR